MDRGQDPALSTAPAAGAPRAGRVVLPDGRALAWTEYGTPGGTPVLYMHGWPGAAVELAHADAPAAARGVRLIGVDRPGIGGSDFRPGRTLLDWAGDVAALLDQLGLARVGLIGCSGGGPYALALAKALPHRLSRVALICPMGPPDHPRVLAELPAPHRFILRLGPAPGLAGLALAPARLFLAGGPASPLVRLGAALYRAMKPPADRRVLADPAVFAAKVRAGQQAFVQGPRGVAWDGHLLASPWGFDPASIEVPVRLWHGVLDDKVPAVMSRVLEAAIPGSRAVYFPDDGHSSIYVDHFDEILAALLEPLTTR